MRYRRKSSAPLLAAGIALLHASPSEHASTVEASLRAVEDSVARGEGVPAQTREHRELLAKKIDVMKRVDRLEEQYRAAQLEAQRLKQQAAAGMSPPVGGANVPPPLPEVVGLGGMKEP